MRRCPRHGEPMPFDDAFYADPYATYARMNAAGRVHRVCLDDRPPEWVLTRFDDVREALRDQRFARHRRHARPDYPVEQIPEVLHAGNVLSEDPPEHTRLRQFVIHAFTAKQSRRLEPRIVELVDSLLSELDGRADLMADFASPLSITLIGELIGVPPGARADFRTWCDDILAGTPEVSNRAGALLLGYFAELVAERTRRPGDDLISDWVRARAGDGTGLSERELVNMPFYLFLAAQDTTVGTLGNAMLGLLTHPGLVARLRAEPDRWPAAVEELMRWDTSALRGWRRFAREDVSIGEVTIPAGDSVNLSIAAAHRDPRRYTEPDTLDIDRTDGQHLGFGRGPHACPGAELARIEVRVALRALFDRFPGVALAVPRDELRWRESTFIRMLTALPVRL